MKYIIVDPDMQNGMELKKILDDYEMLDFQENYTTFIAAGNYSLEHPLDIAFILLGKTEMNTYRLADLIRKINPLSKVISISSHRENAVEAFEYEADGFLLLPFDREKIKSLLQRWNEKRIKVE